MTRRLISTGSPFEKAFGYSRAVVDGNLVFISGTTGYDYSTMIMPDDPADQTRNILSPIAPIASRCLRCVARSWVMCAQPVEFILLPDCLSRK